MVKTKIVATLGPASTSESVLRKMFVRGLDMVRLNFSHGSHPEHTKRIELVRTLNRKMRRAIKIMQDLEGYRIRVGKLLRPVMINKNERFFLMQEGQKANKKGLPFSYKGSLKPIKKGTLAYIDDGKIVLDVLGVEKERLEVKSLVSGVIKQNKGINFPGVKFEFEALTRKDREDAEVAIKYRLDFVAQSFVRNAKDIKILRGIVNSRHKRCKIFAKVENREALCHIDEIIDEADGIIVARGDLGISIPIYKVPVVQKEIIKKCRMRKKPVVVATQMLESMTEELVPTRAEVSDVANAILDGATHLMLSGETTVGKHPHMVVDMMNKVIRTTEEYRSPGKLS